MSRVGLRLLPRATAVGVSAGLRTFTPLATLRPRDRAFRRGAGFVILPAAIGERVADKLPNAPKPTHTPSARRAGDQRRTRRQPPSREGRRTGALRGAAEGHLVPFARYRQAGEGEDQLVDGRH